MGAAEVQLEVAAVAAEETMAVVSAKSQFLMMQHEKPSECQEGGEKEDSENLSFATAHVAESDSAIDLESSRVEFHRAHLPSTVLKENEDVVAQQNPSMERAESQVNESTQIEGAHQRAHVLKNNEDASAQQNPSMEKAESQVKESAQVEGAKQ